MTKRMASVFVLLVLLTACKEITPVPVFEGSSLLDSLVIKGRAPETGYNRNQFRHWIDEDNDGCNTREEILERDAVRNTAVIIDGCVKGADIQDPYSGAVITEEVGKRSAIDIDHVVALGDAWQKGAQNLTRQQRQDFANDPLNLLAVSDVLNSQKQDSDAATWLPPNIAFRCEYVSRQVAVKTKYNLWVTQAEYDSIAGIIQGCK